MRIRTQVLVSFVLMLALLAGVAGVAIRKAQEIGGLAGELNGRMLDKARIAADIRDLSQQIRALDALVLRIKDPGAVALSRGEVATRERAMTSQIDSYARLVDTPLERSLLGNLVNSLRAYTAAEHDMLPAAPGLGAEQADADDALLGTRFAQLGRQAKGLSLVAETEARAAREGVERITQEARTTVLIVAGLASTMAIAIFGMLLVQVFRPLARITEALVALSQGRLDVPLRFSSRGGEINRMAQALEVFRGSAAALTQAHHDLKAAHRRADALARHDALTGLPNRRMIAGVLAEALGPDANAGSAVAVLVVDLDRFKPVNDLYGHGAGDAVLCAVAGRLAALLRHGDLAGRLGGDEFAIVLPFEPGSDLPVRLAKRVLAALTASIAIAAAPVSIGASIGIAVGPVDGGDAEALLHAADLAMLKAKREGRGSFRFFEPEMDVQLRARAELETRIRRAIHKDEIRPFYQPIVDLRTERIVGLEVLSRWFDGDAVRAPADFIAVAEEAGLMPELTYSVLRQACRDSRGWPSDLTLALNVTPAQIADEHLPDTLLGLLEAEGFAAARLELEVTENALIGDVRTADRVMAALRGAGMRISLDDFGTGYSSLHHLRDLRFDTLKIDRSFVQSMLTNPEATKIVETILALGRGLGIRIIAEGIENHEHLLRLRVQGCEFGQGYHFGRPVSAAAMGDLLAQLGVGSALIVAA